jgi:hypothetical protein
LVATVKVSCVMRMPPSVAFSSLQHGYLPLRTAAVLPPSEDRTLKT